VRTTIEVWPELFHVWQGLAPHLSESAQAVERIGAFIRRQTGPGARQPALAR